MKGLHKIASEFAPGDRVVTARDLMTDLHGTKRFRDMHIERVKTIDHDAVRLQHNARVTLESEHGEREVLLGHSTFHGDAPMRVVWADPLPVDDAAALALVAGAFASHDRREAMVLWIAAVVEGVAYCHVLTDDVHADDGLCAGDGGMRYGMHAIAVRETDGMAPRRIVVGLHRGAEETEGRAIHAVTDLLTILDDVGLADGARALPARRPKYSEFASGNFAGMHAIREAEDVAHARTQPSEALVLAFLDGDSTIVRVLGSSGIAFHHLDCAEDYIEPSVPGPGLWMFVDARMRGYCSHEGEYDADLDGRLVPAVLSDVERMVGDVEGARREILEHVGDTEPSMEDLIAQAAATLQDA